MGFSLSLQDVTVSSFIRIFSLGVIPSELKPSKGWGVGYQSVSKQP